MSKIGHSGKVFTSETRKYKGPRITSAQKDTVLVPLFFTLTKNLTKAREGRKGFSCSQFEVINSSVVEKAWC